MGDWKQGVPPVSNGAWSLENQAKLDVVSYFTTSGGRCKSSLGIRNDRYFPLPFWNLYDRIFISFQQGKEKLGGNGRLEEQESSEKVAVRINGSGILRNLSSTTNAFFFVPFGATKK